MARTAFAMSRGERPLRVVFVNRFFCPDESATSQLLGDLCFHLARRGHEVHVICSRQLHGDPKARLAAGEVVEHVQVHRVWTTRFGRMNLAGRMLDYLTFYVTAAARLWLTTARGDVVVAKTDPPLISVVAAWVACRRGAGLVNWVQDVFPEVALRLGVRAGGGALGLLLMALRDYSLRRARVNVAVGERMACHLRQRAPGSEVTVIHNWSDGERLRPLGMATQNDLRREWALDHRFVVAYSGNLGRAHDFDTVLAACERLRERAEIVFLFIGDGPQKRRLESEAARRGLANVLFRPPQPRRALASSLAVGDAHLVTLHPALEGLVVPSKFYGIAAVARPIVFVGDPSGEIARLIAAGDCGVVVETGDVAGLVAAIERMLADRSWTSRIGLNARALFEARFDMPVALDHWENLLERAAGRAAALPM